MAFLLSFQVHLCGPILRAASGNTVGSLRVRDPGAPKMKASVSLYSCLESYIYHFCHIPLEACL